MTRNLRAALALAIGTLLVSDLAMAGRLDTDGPVVPVNNNLSETRLACA